MPQSVADSKPSTEMEVLNEKIEELEAQIRELKAGNGNDNDYGQ